MVKFSFLALASALATVNAGGRTTHRRTRAVKLGDRNLRRGDPGTEALLKKARPYRKNSAANASRRLEGEEAEFEIDGSYNLKFSQCVDVRTMDEDLFGDDIVEYVQAGQVVSAKSYVLFHVCQGDDCYYDAEADLYIVDLPTYLTNVATYHANKRSDYCEACEEFADVCNVEEEEEEAAEDEANEEDADEEEGDEEEDQQDEEQGDEEEGDEEDQEGEEDEQEGEEDNEGEEEGDEGEDEGEDRKLKKTKRKLSKKKKINRKAITRKLANKNYIDCDQCAAYECYVDEDDLDDQAEFKYALDEDVSEWIGDLAECKESGQQLNGIDVYIGAMCSPYGDGVELAVFLNDECTMYTNQMSFYNAWQPEYDNDDGINYLTYAEEFIKNSFSEVTSCLQPEYADPNEENDDADADEDEEEEYQVNDYCQQVMEGDFADFNNCAVDEAEDEEDADDQYNWYTYDLKEADDIDEVCVTLNAMDGEFSYAYDEEASGTWYERNRNGDIVDADASPWSIPELTLEPGIIAAIVAMCVVVVGGAAFLCRPKKKHSDSSEPVYQGGTML